MRKETWKAAALAAAAGRLSEQDDTVGVQGSTFTQQPEPGLNGPAGPTHGDPIFGQPEFSGDVWNGVKVKVISMDDLLDYLDLGVDPFDALDALSEEEPYTEGDEETVGVQTSAEFLEDPEYVKENSPTEDRKYQLFVADRVEEALPNFDNESDRLLGQEIIKKLREEKDPRVTFADCLDAALSLPEAEEVNFIFGNDEQEPFDYKFREGESLDEIRRYIEDTYNGPYSGKRGVQALDLIDSADHGLGFCMGNAIKYAARYGKKDGHNKKDILKAIHYLIMALYVVKDENIK